MIIHYYLCNLLDHILYTERKALFKYGQHVGGIYTWTELGCHVYDYCFYIC